jgi:preprotein translocase subunit SecY
MIYGSLIIFFCFFYTALVFNSRETAENLREGRSVHSRASGPASRRRSTSTRC